MLKTITQDFLQLIYPNLCLGCGNRMANQEGQICFSCIESLPYTNESIHKNSLLDKLAALSPIAGSYALCYYNRGSIVQELMKELKYRKQPSIGVSLGQLLGDKLIEQSFSVDEIVPVPLHPKRKRKRGYNQARKIAEGVSEKLDVPINEVLLLRTVNTKTQTNRSKLNRFENVENIFAIEQSEQLKGKRFLLIDDVVTTGATMLSCAKVLFDSGAEAVYIAAVGKADALG